MTDALQTTLHDAARAVADRFEAATKAHLDARLLQKRFDRKYVMPAVDVPALLEHLQASHLALPGNTPRMALYETDYLDTPELSGFHDHRRGRPRRLKARARAYIDRNLSFLEVKRRTGRGQTDKARLARADARGPLSAAEDAWLLDHTDGQHREFALQTAFYRLTLLGRAEIERLTVDIGLRFARNGNSARLQNVAIVEVKTPGPSQRGVAVRWLHDRGMRPMGFSKYCVGLTLVDPSLPRHSFARPLRRAHRLEASWPS